MDFLGCGNISAAVRAVNYLARLAGLAAGAYGLESEVPRAAFYISNAGAIWNTVARAQGVCVAGRIFPLQPQVERNPGSCIAGSRGIDVRARQPVPWEPQWASHWAPLPRLQLSTHSPTAPLCRDKTAPVRLCVISGLSHPVPAMPASHKVHVVCGGMRSPLIKWK